MRATGKVKRGLGTIRQDINISISGGARQEIKGIQELNLIPEVIRREVQRQLGLLEIRAELERREVEEVKVEAVDVTEVFSNTSCKVLRGALELGGRVLACKLQGFGGLLGKELQPGRRFGTELADHAKLYGKVRGIFHTDELPAYGITQEEINHLRRVVEVEPKDVVVFIAGSREAAEAALQAVVRRANQAIQGVPEETRRALPDGNTEFMRPLPGAARMYPETDIPPCLITRERLEKLREKLPELPEHKIGRYQKEHGLSADLAGRLVASEKAELFEQLLRETEAEPKLIATTLMETLVSLKREGVPVHRITDRGLVELFKLVASKRMGKESIPEVLQKLAEGLEAEEALRELGISAMSEEELTTLVQRILEERETFVRERGEDAVKPLMGILMKEVKGRADGKLVHEILKREIRKFLGAG
jgi:glutamyl-tRNA(Gln) amidotransferase subunit E